MSSEVALAIFAGLTIVVQILLYWLGVRQQKKSDREIRYRGWLSDVRDAAALIVQLRHIQTLGNVTNDLPALVAAYAMATAKLHTSAIAINDTDLNEAVAMFLEDDRDYRDVAAKGELRSNKGIAAGGEFQLSYMGLLMRCNELSE